MIGDGTLIPYKAKMNLIKSEKISIRLHFKDSSDNIVILNEDDILADDGVTITTHINPDTDLTFGKVISSELMATLIKSAKTDTIDWSKWVSVLFGNSTVGYHKVGLFKCDPPERTNTSGMNILNVRGTTNIWDMNKSADDFIASLTFPITIRSLWTSFSTYTNIPFEDGCDEFLDDSYSINENPFSNGCTLNDILKYIAEAEGFYVTYSYNGIYKTRIFISSPASLRGDVHYTLTPDDYFTWEKSDLVISPPPAIELIDTTKENNNASYPSSYSGFPYKIVNNPILNALSSADKDAFLLECYNKRLNYGDNTRHLPSYIPMKIECVGNHLIEAGDIIFIEDKDGNEYPMRIFSRTLTWNGTLTDYYECTGNEERANISEDSEQEIYNDGRYVTKTEVNEPTRITPTIDTSKWTIGSSDCYALGSIVFVNLRVTSNSSILGVTGIELPKPINNGGFSGISALVNASNQQNLRATILPDGRLYAMDTIANNTIMVFTFAYVSTVNNIASFIV